MVGKKGPIWDYFTQVSCYMVKGYKKPSKVTQCNICKTELTQTDGSTTCLRNHLRRFHESEYDNLFPSTSQPEVTISQPVPSTSASAPTNSRLSKLSRKVSGDVSQLQAKKRRLGKEAVIEESLVNLPEIEKSVLKEPELEKSVLKEPALEKSVVKDPDFNTLVEKEPEFEKSRVKEPVFEKLVTPNEANICEEDTTVTNEVAVSRRKRILIPNILSKCGIYLPAQIEAEILFTLASASSGFSTDAVNTFAMQNYFQNVLPVFNLREASHFSKYSLNIAFTNIKSKVYDVVICAVALQERIYVHCGLISGTRGHYLQVSLTFIDGEFDYHHVILGIRQVSFMVDAPGLKEAFESVLMEYEPVMSVEKVFIYDQGNYILDLAVKSSKLVKGRINCLVSQMDRSLRLGLTDVEAGLGILRSTYDVLDHFESGAVLRQEIQQLCREKTVPYKHIPMSVVTGDIVASLRAVLTLERPLTAMSSRLQDRPALSYFSEKIPTQQQFQILQLMNYIISRLENHYKVMKSDAVICHRYFLDLMNLKRSLESAHATLGSSCQDDLEEKECFTLASQIVKSIEKKLSEEFGLDDTPPYGVMLFAFFHPGYKAKLWNTPVEYHDFVAKFVNNDQSTIDFFAERDKASAANLANTETDDNFAQSYCRQRMMQFEQLERQKLLTTGDDVPPLKKEVDIYLGMAKAAHDVNVLYWWKENSALLPLLSAIARRVLSIPVTSSTGIRPYRREGINLWENNLEEESDERILKLMFIQANHDRVCIDIPTWDFSLQPPADDNDMPVVPPISVEIEVAFDENDDPVLVTYNEDAAYSNCLESVQNYMPNNTSSDSTDIFLSTP